MKRSSWQHTSCSMTAAEIHVVIVIQINLYEMFHTPEQDILPQTHLSAPEHPSFPLWLCPNDTNLSATFEFCQCCSAENWMGL